MKKKYDSQTNRYEIQSTTYSNQDVVKLLSCSQEQKKRVVQKGVQST